jgi:two-component system, OmpR family, sensor histidine kinase ArlS
MMLEVTASLASTYESLKILKLVLIVASLVVLLFILLDNALKYSASSIELYIGYENDHVFLSVEDHGIGIPKEDIAHIFERFYRVDKARNRETGGTGLGLSIAKQIVDSHGGNINVVSKEGEGTSFTVTLPI